MSEMNRYTGINDAEYTKPYIDQDEWRDTPVKHRYVHGGFEGTGTRFCLYFPEKGRYQGRFFQRLDPVQGPETFAQTQGGEEDVISFSILHGAYFVESNLGGALNGGGDASVLYRCSAQVAEYGRKVAQEMYQCPRPYGYIFGGSGGAFKTISCAENTEGIWDGAVPFVIGSPAALPSVYTIRSHAMRILRHKLPEIADALEPGGSGDPYQSLNAEEQEALREVTNFGFPLRTWTVYQTLGEGSLPLLFPAVKVMDPTYFTDFWTKPGYLGTEKESSAARDRIHFDTTIKRVYMNGADVTGAAESIDEKNAYGVDEAWKHIFGKAGVLPVLELSEFPDADIYTQGMIMHFESGALAGQDINLKYLKREFVTGESDISGRNLGELMNQIRPGDNVTIDNSDYLAVQTYHRHQVPDASYPAWNQYRDKDGNPIPPQRSFLVGPMIALGGAGSVQNGKPSCRMIVLESLMDESAFPWQADWYRKLIQKNRGNNADNFFRLYYMDHCMHTDCDENNGGDHSHIVSYLGALYQALLDLSAWVEKGKAPVPSTTYSIKDGIVLVPDTAKERGGVQLIARLRAETVENVSENGVIRVKTGTPVRFTAEADIPDGAGSLCSALWNFGDTGKDTFAESGTLNKTTATAEHIYSHSGTFFCCIRLATNRNPGDPYTKVRDIARIRVIAE